MTTEKSKWASIPKVVRIDTEIHEHLIKAAEREHRSVANLIGVIILEWVKNDKGSK